MLPAGANHGRESLVITAYFIQDHGLFQPGTRGLLAVVIAIYHAVQSIQGLFGRRETGFQNRQQDIAPRMIG